MLYTHTNTATGRLRPVSRRAPTDPSLALPCYDEVKRQAQARQMGEQLYAVAFKRRVETRTAAGKVREKWQRGYRVPRTEDDNSAAIAARLTEKIAEWEALGIIPTEDIGEISNYDRGHRMYGMTKWADFLSPRQLLTLGFCVEAFCELATRLKSLSPSQSPKAAALVYLAIANRQIRQL